ncbi:MAG TPA: hypothetical protein VLW85_17670 [Myxococcales bacterium]|nr:hypothetical protein [Myxococcales bacterium]
MNDALAETVTAPMCRPAPAGGTIWWKIVLTCVQPAGSSQYGTMDPSGQKSWHSGCAGGQ